MATSDVQNEALAATILTPSVSAGEQTYPMSREGRRQAIVLLLGVISIWIFALWSLTTILQDGVSGVEWVSLLLMIGMLVVAPVVAWTLLEEANTRIITDSKGMRYQTISGIILSYSWEELEGFKTKEGRSRVARFFLGDDGEPNLDDKQARKAETGESRPGGRINNATGEQSGKEVAAGAEPEAKMAQSTPTDSANLPDNTGDNDDADEPETLLLNARTDHTDQIANPVARFLHKQAHGASLPIYGGLENRAQLLSEIEARLRET